MTLIPRTDLLTAFRSALAGPAAYQPPTNAIPTGISGLNDLLTPGTLTVIAGRWGHGADVLATHLARTAAVHNSIPTLFTSGRNSDRIIMEHLIAAQAGVPLIHLENGKLTDHDRNRIDAISDAMRAAPLFINSTDRTITQVAYHAKKTHARLVVVESAHLLVDETRIKNDEHRAEVQSRRLALLAREFEIPVVVAVPLVAREGRPADAKPIASDFGYRRAFELDADAVILMHRPELNDELHRAGEVDIAIVKHRNGDVGTVTACFQAAYDRILEIPKDSQR